MKRNLIKDTRGFTLIEMMCMLIIISVMATVVVKKHGEFVRTAEMRGVQKFVSMLNAQEHAVWASQKLLLKPMDDATVFDQMVYDPTGNYYWKVNPTPIGGTVSVYSTPVPLKRIPSQPNQPARWEFV